MSKLYNTQKEITTNFRKFLSEKISKIRKTQLNILPEILFGMIQAESVSATDIAKNLKDEFSLVQFDSVAKRIRRFFNNKIFKPYEFYKDFISFVISNYKKKHHDKRVHLIFDHMFSHENYTVFMITMRVGKQGIPIWFRCFKGKDNSDAFATETIKDGITKVSEMFESTDLELIFLADRWFNSTELLRHIDSLGHTYCIRLKKNIHVYPFDKKESHIIQKYIGELSYYKHKSTTYKEIPFTDERYITNIVFSDWKDVEEPWIVATNGDTNRAIKDYSYRFGGIESVFKNQKTNGFNLEKICNANITAFTTMYTLLCVCITYLTLLGADYSKNTRCYKNEKIETHKTYILNGKRTKKRIMSLFNTGLTLFKRAFCSLKYIRLPFTFILYDI